MESSARSRRFKIPTVRNLENVALHYLSRYAASEFSLRRVLENRLRRAAQRDPAFAANDALQKELATAIARIIETHKKSGILNDAAYAELKTASLRRAGRSARAIALKLGQHGIARALVAQSLDNHAEGNEAGAELQAALALAKRKRIGPFRTRDAGPETARKDLAALARAGFSFAVAKQVLGKSAADIEEEF